MITRTPKEQAYLESIRQHITTLHDCLNKTPTPITTDDPAAWFEFVGQIRAIQGNTSNDFSFLACLLAKGYLSKRFEISDFDAAAKPQGAPGLDVDIITADGKRVIAEIKTTVPYSGTKNDLGAQQKANFKNDFNKLNKAQADYKFFFVTDLKTYNIVQQRYFKLIPGVEIVLLTEIRV